MSSVDASRHSGSPTPGTFLAQLEPSEWARLRELGHGVKFPSGSVLMYEREPSDRIMILLSGHVKVTRVDGAGHETMLSIRDPGDMLGELAFIDGHARVATVTALEPVEAVMIPASLFRTHLERTPRVAVALLQVVTRRFRETTLKRSQFGATDTVGRLADRLVELAERYGEKTDDDGLRIGLALSQDELAAWTSASRAGLAHALQTLRDLGWIETQRRRVIVRDLEALRARGR
jgi:CRP/FNR family cyclic AMP-dependent transcriptional regulator